MMTGRWLSFYVTFALILLAVACAVEVAQVDEGPASGVRVRSDSAPNARIKMNTVAIIDKSLQVESHMYKKSSPAWIALFQGGKERDSYVSKIAVEAANSRRSSTDTLEVWVSFRNRIDYPLTLEARTSFFDESERMVEEPSAWQRVFLEGQGVGSYSEYSKGTSGIAYYYVEVREAR